MTDAFIRFKGCALCGQVGQQLVKTDEDVYVCGIERICKMRKNATKGKTICSMWWCMEEAEMACTCSMNLCKVHAKTPTHRGHSMKKL